MNRERLFARLGTTAYAALVDATALGRSKRHAYIDLDHWALCLLKRERSDLVLLLSELGVDIATLAGRLEAALAKVPAAGDSLRDISAVLEQSVAPAITWSQIAAASSHVRTGHLLLAWLDVPATRRWLVSHDARGPSNVSVEDAVARFEALAAGWPEARETNPLRASDVSIASGADDASPHDALARWGICMSEQAARGELDPVVGRGDELRAVIDILLRRRQNNPILVGEAGVGKTAIVEGLAHQIHARKVPQALAEAQVWALDLTRLQAGASARGEFEQRLRSVLDAVAASPRPIILFCDEAHALVGAGGTPGTGDAANVIKPMLARGQLRLVAATTWSEYKQFIEPDAALVRRFQAVAIDEPDDAVALDMLRVIAPRFAMHHRVQISDAALKAAVQLSRRHLPARQLPDKAVGLLDTACARVAMSQSCAPVELDRLERRVESVEHELQWRIADRRIGIDVLAGDDDLIERREKLVTQAAALRRSADAEREAVRAWLASLDAANHDSSWRASRPTWVQPWVDAEAIAQVLSEWTGVPCLQLQQDDAGRLARLHAFLEERVHGQSGALASIAQALQVARSGLGDPGKPVAVMLLAGPTGSGKSQTALALAELLFDGEKQLIQFNMNEFQEAHTISTLKGAPPGYVGFGKGGRLTEAVRKKPHCVLLLDEFDRAHPDVHEIFYQAFDQGWMEDGEGRRVSFRNCLIVLTSNVGDAELRATLAAHPETTQVRLDAIAREQLQRKLSPPLIARMQVLAYRPLTVDALEQIALHALAEVGKRVEARSLSWSADPQAAAWIAKAVAFHPASGRAVRDLLRMQVVPRIAQGMLAARAAGKSLHAVHLSAEEGLALAFDDDAVALSAEALSLANPVITQEPASCA